MDINTRSGNIYIPRLIDLAHNTDRCHVLLGTRNDSQLGQFYVENGFIPSVENLSDEVFELLDFEKIGRNLRMEEHGAFIFCGYVVRSDDLSPVFDTLDLALKTPAYIFRCVLNNYPYDEEDPVRLNVPLDLPATEEELDAALGKLDAPNWDSVIFDVEDSAIPDILDDADLFFDGMDRINKLAQVIQYRKERGELPKLKAVLHATDCGDVSAAISIAENLDGYLYESTERSPEDVAMEELRLVLDDKALSILQKHVNLYNYGRELITANHASMTPYGLVERQDGQPIQAPEEPQQGGLEMT